MKPIKEYDLVNEAGEFKRLPAGAYPIKLTKVNDVPEKEYLEVFVDIVKGEYKDYFSTLVANGLNDSSRTCRSYKTNALPFFKGFITAIEKSNQGYQWNWDEKSLEGKYAIGVFGEEEYLKDGEVRVGTKLVEIRSIQAFKEGKIKIPELKKLPEDQLPVQQESTNLESVEITDDDLPF